MIDKIYRVNNKEVIIFFTNKKSFTLYCGDNNVIHLLDELLAPLHSNCITLSEWEHRVKVGKEDTQTIELDRVA